MKLITYFDSNLTKDCLKNLSQYSDYIAVYPNDFITAFNIFGKSKTYILMRDWQDSTQIPESMLSDTDIIFQITEDSVFEYRNKQNIMFFNHATTWEQLNHLASLGAAAIIIDAPLTFETNLIKRWKQIHPVQIFAIADSESVIDVRQWFLRPEDYSQCEETLDAICVKPSLIKVYAHKMSPSRLSMLIPSIDEFQNANALYMSPQFQEKRMNCRQRCQEPDGLCSHCIRIVEIAQQLERIRPNGN